MTAYDNERTSWLDTLRWATHHPRRVFREFRRLSHMSRASVDEVLDGVRRSMSLPADERWFQLMQADGFLRTRNGEDALVARAALTDLMLVDIAVMTEAARSADDRAECVELRRLAQEERKRLPHTPDFERRVGAVRTGLVT